MYKYVFKPLGNPNKNLSSNNPKKYNKENYITARNNPLLWRHHETVQCMELYENYINGKILDIGCNHGGITYWLRLFDSVTEVHGIDLNQQSLHHAKNNFTHFNRPYKFHCLNLVEAKLNEKFDTIISFHVLEHIFEEDIEVFLKHAYEMLNDSGHLLLQIPYKKSYKDPCHVTFWDEDSLSLAMQSVGFEVLKCYKTIKSPIEGYGSRDVLTGLFRKNG